MTDQRALAAWFAPGVRATVITGAGISTASGIAAYRSTDGSWKHAAPVQMQDFLRDPAMRRRYWARSLLGWPVIASARPNAAHAALARLEAGGRLRGLITQNVDGLHQRAGHQDVIELHGSLGSVMCLSCDWTCARAEMQTWLTEDNPWLLDIGATAAPDGDAALADRVDLTPFRVRACPACAGVLKPTVVFYGDSVPRARVEDAYARVESADVLLVAGSSLMVFSSFRFCRHAHARGIPIIAVNDGVTRADELFALKLEADCGAVLTALAYTLAATG
jgi:NAD-dependent SIR2 family protein deacetylase